MRSLRLHYCAPRTGVTARSVRAKSALQESALIVVSARPRPIGAWAWANVMASARALAAWFMGRTMKATSGGRKPKNSTCAGSFGLDTNASLAPEQVKGAPHRRRTLFRTTPDPSVEQTHSRSSPQDLGVWVRSQASDRRASASECAWLVATPLACSRRTFERFLQR